MIVHDGWRLISTVEYLGSRLDDHPYGLISHVSCEKADSEWSAGYITSPVEGSDNLEAHCVICSEKLPQSVKDLVYLSGKTYAIFDPGEHPSRRVYGLERFFSPKAIREDLQNIIEFKEQVLNRSDLSRELIEQMVAGIQEDIEKLEHKLKESIERTKNDPTK